MKVAKLVDYLIFPVLAINFYVWGDSLDWEWGEIGLLEFFPLLGLIAFSTMWWHFFTAFMRRIKPELTKHEGLHRTSAYWVFASFMLHPLLLLVWGIQDGIGWWPPDTYREYVGRAQMPFIYLGMLALGGFLLYDTARVLRRQAWVGRNRNAIIAISDLSFVAILVHSLNLGQHLQSGWLRTYWLGLGLSGIGFILYRYYYNSRNIKQKKEHGAPTKN